MILQVNRKSMQTTTEILFRWVIKAAMAREISFSNGATYYDKDGRQVAQKVDGQFYIAVKRIGSQ